MKSKETKSGSSFMQIIFLLPVFVISLLFLSFVATLEIGAGDEVIEDVEPQVIVDTIPALGDGYLQLLRDNYLLSVSEITVGVPYYRTINEDGFFGSVAGAVMDVTAEQYVCMNFVVKAGIETREIQILEDSVKFNSDRSISEMTVVLPAPRITRSYIDYSEIEFYFNEGHVSNTASNTLDFIVTAIDDVEAEGIQTAINRGIFEDARTASAAQVTELLHSVGVEEVNIIFEDSENYIALANSGTNLNRGE